MRLVILTLLALTTTAHACWDGHLITADRVTLRGARDTWDIDHVRAYGRWLPRIQALLGDSHSVVDEGINLLCPGTDDATDDCVELKKSAPEEIFEEIAQHLKRPAKVVQAARTLKTGAWTVQLAAGDLLPLRKRADEINGALRFRATGFAEYGGFPADNPIAFVVPRSQEHHALILGTFLTAAEAHAAVAALAKDHAITGYARPL